MTRGNYPRRNRFNRNSASLYNIYLIRTKALREKFWRFSRRHVLWNRLCLASFSLICILFPIIYRSAFRVTTQAQKTSSAWYIGSSRIDITPSEQVWLSGFSSRARTAMKSLNSSNRLFATSLAMSYRKSSDVHTKLPLVIVSLDIVGIDKEVSNKIYSSAQQQFGLPRESLRICVTHTHSGPVVGNNLRPLVPDDPEEWKKITRYTLWLEEQILKSIRLAMVSSNEAVPSTAYTSSASVQLAINRRQIPEHLFTKERRGVTEDRVPILWFETDNHVVAGIYGFAAHASVITQGYSYSGDYPGFASRFLEQNFPRSTWLFLASCGGDQNIYPRGSQGLAEKHGRVLSRAVISAIQVLDRYNSDSQKDEQPVALHSFVSLSFAKQYSRFELRRRARSGKTVDRRAATILLEGLNENGLTNSTYQYPIAVWKLNGIKLAFLGGEPTVAYCSMLRKMGIFWVVGYCEDVMGYIGSEDVIREGGREGGERAAWYYGLPAAWDPSTEQKILSRVQQMLDQPSLR